MPNKTGIWGALGTPKATRIISVCMLLYLLVLGGLTYGYAKVSGCLAAYADQSATSQAARAEAAAEDRHLNEAEGKLEDSDRSRYAADQAAMSKALAILLNPNSGRDERADAFSELLKVNQETTRILAINAAQRDGIRQDRAQVEKARQANPVPPPPSETC